MAPISFGAEKAPRHMTSKRRDDPLGTTEEEEPATGTGLDQEKLGGRRSNSAMEKAPRNPKRFAPTKSPSEFQVTCGCGGAR